MSVSVYGCHQGAADNWDTLSWAYLLAVLAATCQLFTAKFFIIHQKLCTGVRPKANATPLISPASSTMSLDEIPPSQPLSGRVQVRMRVCDSASMTSVRRDHVVAALVEQTFSFEDL